MPEGVGIAVGMGATTVAVLRLPLSAVPLRALRSDLEDKHEHHQSRRQRRLYEAASVRHQTLGDDVRPRLRSRPVGLQCDAEYVMRLVVRGIAPNDLAQRGNRAGREIQRLELAAHVVAPGSAQRADARERRGRVAGQDKAKCKSAKGMWGKLSDGDDQQRYGVPASVAIAPAIETTTFPSLDMVLETDAPSAAECATTNTPAAIAPAVSARMAIT